MMGTRALLVLFLLFFRPCPAWADAAHPEKEATPGPPKSKEGRTGEAVEERLSVTRHSIVVNGRTLSYTATAGLLPILDEAGKPEAGMFFIAYVKEQKHGEAPRPVTFAFNGGPGASSVWLNLGAFGPRRVALPGEQEALPPPYPLVDNEYSLLDVTDLVFIDPVGTGYSRPAPGVDAKKFLGVKGDVESCGEFIRVYTTRFQRWNAPKFLLGESYGSMRAVLLAKRLHSAYGLDINGWVLISSALDFQNFVFSPGNDLPYVLFLPSYTAAAYFHKKLPPDLQERDLETTLREVEQWSLNEYLPALAKGEALSEPERKAVAERLKRFTGLSEDYVKRKKLKVRDSDFRRELLRKENRVLGLLDARLTGVEEPEENFEYDPSMVLTIGPYVAALNAQLKEALKFETQFPYQYFSGEANRSWHWGSAVEGYPSVTEPLGALMEQFRYLNVFFARGYYDLDIPYFATPYDVDHLGLDPSLRDHVTVVFYEAGHQMYTHLPSLKRLKADVSSFLRDCLSGTAAGPAEAEGSKENPFDRPAPIDPGFSSVPVSR